MLPLDTLVKLEVASFVPALAVLAYAVHRIWKERNK